MKHFMEESQGKFQEKFLEDSSVNSSYIRSSSGQDFLNYLWSKFLSKLSEEDFLNGTNVIILAEIYGKFSNRILELIFGRIFRGISDGILRRFSKEIHENILKGRL